MTYFAKFGLDYILYSSSFSTLLKFNGVTSITSGKNNSYDIFRLSPCIMVLTLNTCSAAILYSFSLQFKIQLFSVSFKSFKIQICKPTIWLEYLECPNTRFIGKLKPIENCDFMKISYVLVQKRDFISFI